MRQELPIFVLLTSAGRVLRVAPLTLAVIVACAPGVGDEAVEGGGTIDLVTAELSVPEGFRIEVYASGLPSVRTLKASPDGQLYAVLSEEGLIVRLDLTTPQASPYVVAEDLDRPYGLAFRGEDLYVGEEHQVVRLTGPDFSVRTVVVPRLPRGGHWTREIVFGADGMLHVSVGSSCNICEEADARRAAVSRYRPDGSGGEIVARGLRNAAGLALHPETAAIWASQNERDNLGEDLPPEEINIISDGEDFGWPYCYGQRIPNPEYADRVGRCASTTPPALEMQEHSALLGMTFYTGAQFPDEYRGDLFVAFHGSWNRRVPTGYLLAHVEVVNGHPVSYSPFASGWLSTDGEERGRPVYPAVGSDGSLHLSDDEGGRIYRIHWVGR